MKYVTSVERLAIERGHKTGVVEGRLEGKLEGKLEALTRLLTRRFGPLPEWVAERTKGASAEQLDIWFDRGLDSTTLTEIFGGH